MSLPAIFVERLKHIVAADYYESIINSFSEKEPTCIRINLLRALQDTTLNELAQLGVLLTPCAWRSDAFMVNAEHRLVITHAPVFMEGRIAVQNFSSMVPVMVLDPQPGEEILDLAAAPGGKTALMSMMMNNTGRIAAVEVVKNRFFKLRNQLEMLGVTNAECYLKDGREVGKQCPERFDRVLLDAPCSSESRFRVDDSDSYAYWSERKIKEMQHKQKRLLLSALQSVKVGGVVVYSTCSFSPEENELVVASALKKYGDAVEILPLSLPFANTQTGLVQWQGKALPASLSNAVRILPSYPMEGFFLCLMRKNMAI